MLSVPVKSLSSSYKIEAKKEIFPYQFFDSKEVSHSGGYTSWSRAKAQTRHELGSDWNEFIKNAIAWHCVDAETDTFRCYRYAAKYCQQDVNTVLQALTVFSALIRDITGGLDFWNFATITSLGSRFLASTGAYDNMFKVCGHVRMFLSRAIVGGRTTSAGLQKYYISALEPHAEANAAPTAEFSRCPYRENEVLTCVDAVSLYPSAVHSLAKKDVTRPRAYQRNGYALGKPKVFDGSSVSLDWLVHNTDLFFAEVTILGRDRNKDWGMPCLSYKGEDGGRYFSNDLEGRTSVLTSYDIEQGQVHHGYKYRLHRGYFWDEGCTGDKAAQQVEVFFKQRLEAKRSKNKALSTVIKLLLNSSFYGRSIMRPTESETKIVGRDDFFGKKLCKWYNRIITATKFGRKYIVKLTCSTQSSSNCPQIGAVVLSESKRLMNELLSTTKRLGAPAFFGDTDSIHMRLADLPRVEEEFKKARGTSLVGTWLGQLHDDIDAPKISGPVYEIGSSISGLCVYVGKKSYFDEVYTCIRRTKGGPLTWIRSTHCRMKGVTSAALQDSANRAYNGSLRRMYLAMYDQQKVKFNLCCKGSRVQRSTKTQSYVNITSFYRTVSFPTPAAAFHCDELRYRVRPPRELEASDEESDEEEALDLEEDGKKTEQGADLSDEYSEWVKHAKRKRLTSRSSHHSS